MKNVWISEDNHNDVKMLAVSRKLSMTELLNIMINDYFDNNNCIRMSTIDQENLE